MTAREPWTMPAWMECYRVLIVNTGGNAIEDLMDDRSTLYANRARATLAIAVQSQVTLLTALHAAGLLGEDETPGGDLLGTAERRG